MYVLIILSHIYGGYTLDHIEFTNKENCEKAREMFIKNDWQAHLYSYCVQK